MPFHRSSIPLALALALLAACTEPEPTDAGLVPIPAPDVHPANAGPGGPRNSFSEAELYRHCAYLEGNDDDPDHHNLAVMFDGYLVLPAAPEWGGGGLTFWDVSDGCAPRRIGAGFDPMMRESHSIAFARVGEKTFAVVNHLRGVQFWDVTDPRHPAPHSELELPGVFYPDAYARVVFAVFWQGRFVYAAGTDNGIYIIDAADPDVPVLAAQYKFELPLRAGGIWVIGNLLVTMATEGTRTALLDVSDPLRPVPIPGGLFTVTDGAGDPTESYLANIAGDRIVYARKQGGGGPLVWDISDVQRPVFRSELRTEGGNGGYSFMKDSLAYVGDSHWGVIVDFADEANPVEVTRVTLKGDLDTLIPLGNMAIASVDDGANPGEGSAMIPLFSEPDTRGPAVTMVYPRHGATGLPLSSRFGVVFSEMVDVKSVFTGSVTLIAPEGKAVAADYNVQENIVNLSPRAPLRAATRYRLVIPPGGVRDYNGNRTEAGFEASFTTR